MGMWALFAAPLLVSAEMETVPLEDRELMQNPWLIAINQDPLGHQARYYPTQHPHIKVIIISFSITISLASVKLLSLGRHIGVRHHMLKKVISFETRTYYDIEKILSYATDLAYIDIFGNLNNCLINKIRHHHDDFKQFVVVS